MHELNGYKSSNGKGVINIERIRKNAKAVSMGMIKLRSEMSSNFKQWDIVSRDGTDRQLIYGFNDSRDLLYLVCIKPSDCDYMQDDNWVIGEVESNVYWRYEFVSKCLTPEKLLKQIGRGDLFNDTGEPNNSKG